MRWNELSEENCSMARTVSVIGDRWTLLILRDCFLRVRRFEDFQERLGITRPILASRLKKLVDEFVLVKVPYQQRPPRYEYRLTQKGLDLYPIVMAIVHWGDVHMAGKIENAWLAQGPKVRRLFAGGRRIRTFGPPGLGQHFFEIAPDPVDNKAAR